MNTIIGYHTCVTLSSGKCKMVVVQFDGEAALAAIWRGKLAATTAIASACKKVRGLCRVLRPAWPGHARKLGYDEMSSCVAPFSRNPQPIGVNSSELKFGWGGFAWKL
jgi:hypothetical protein